MQITKQTPPPVPQPPSTVTIVMTEREAQILRSLIGYTTTLTNAVVSINNSSAVRDKGMSRVNQAEYNNFIGDIFLPLDKLV